MILDDDFQELFLKRKIFSHRMLNGIMKNNSPSLDYPMKLLPRGTYEFTQCIGILNETKQTAL